MRKKIRVKAMICFDNGRKYLKGFRTYVQYRNYVKLTPGVTAYYVVPKNILERFLRLF